MEEEGETCDSVSRLSANALSQQLLASSNSAFSSSVPISVPIPLGSTLSERNVMLAKCCVMISVVFERCAYYSFSANMALFVNYHLGWTPTQTAVVVLSFTGLTWLSCFIGGIVSDCWLGKFKAILIGLLLYLIGLAFLPSLSFKTHNETGTERYSVIWFLFTLIIISLGEGLFKSNMSPFGADQLSHAQDEEMRRFFNYFYWSINIGGFLGFGPMTLLQQEYGFTIGYGASLGCILVAALTFLIPRRRNYLVCQPVTNAVTKIFFICRNARRNRNPWQGKGTRANASSTGYEEYVPVQDWLDWAMVKYGGAFLESEVQEVKILFHVLPVFGFIIVYSMCYSQVTGTFILQGIHMNVYRMYKNEMQIPVAWLGLFNIAFVIVFVPIVDRILYPFLERSGRKVPLMVRMSIGMLLGSLSMVAAGLVELQRIHTNGTIYNEVSHVEIPAKDVSLFLQVPQYGLMGMSEIFIIITGMEFAYCHAPKSMQSLLTGILFVAIGAGAFLSSLLIYVADTWCGANFLPNNDMNDQSSGYSPKRDSRMWLLFFILAGLNVLNWLAFLVFRLRRNALRRRKDKDQTVTAFIRGITVANSHTGEA